MLIQLINKQTSFFVNKLPIFDWLKGVSKYKIDKYQSKNKHIIILIFFNRLFEFIFIIIWLLIPFLRKLIVGMLEGVKIKDVSN